jgi:hypothetical protein
LGTIGEPSETELNEEDIMNTLTKIATAILLVGFSAGLAQAEDICMDVKEKKSVDEAKAVAVKAGYADITKMDEEGGCYEAKGLNADGSKFEVYIHPTTLEIVKVKKED